MPQVDLETLVSVCGGGNSDRRIACETDIPTEESDPPEIPPDFPPESFWLSKDAEYDWFDRNAFYERKDSGKGSSTNLNPNPNSNCNTSSQRFSTHVKKTKASIFGLPKQQKPCFTDAKHRRNPANIRLFPKRPAPAGKSDAPLAEPSSPKVSCMGRVRSKRDKNRRLKSLKKSTEPETVTSKSESRRKKGIWTSLRSIFRSGSGKKPIKKRPNDSSSNSRRNSVTEKSRTANGPAAEQPPPALGGMLRFASGRRSDAWADDVDTTNSEPLNRDHQPPGLGGMVRFASGRKSDAWADDVDAIKSEPLDPERVWKRRVVDPLKEINCSRDWVAVGPVSV